MKVLVDVFCSEMSCFVLFRMGLCSANFYGNGLCEGFYSAGLQFSHQVQPERPDTFVIHL